jgi:hypothetical protein
MLFLFFSFVFDFVLFEFLGLILTFTDGFNLIKYVLVVIELLIGDLMIGLIVGHLLISDKGLLFFLLVRCLNINILVNKRIK